MYHNFGFEITCLLKKAEELRFNLKHPYVGTEHLMLAILQDESSVSKILNDFGINYQNFLQELELVIGKASKSTSIVLYTPMLKRVLETSLNNASENNNGHLTKNHLICAMLEEGDGIAIRILMRFNIDLDELYDTLKENITPSKKNKNLEIMKIGINLTNKNNKDKIYGREKEIQTIIETLLRKQKNNPLLIGKAGVGKTAIVEELARKIVNKEVPLELQNMQIYAIEMGSLVAGTKYRGEFEERLTKMIKEIIKEKNIIIFIDEIHSMVNAGGAEGAICASDILKPYLARGELKVIGSTTIGEYHEFIAKDKALDRRFEKIMIEEPTKEDMFKILKNIKNSYEKHYKINITDDNLNDIVNLADEYIFSKNNPDKSIELLDSVCAKIKCRHNFNNDKEELSKIIKQKENLLINGDFNDALKIAKKEQKIRENPNFNNDKLEIKKEDIIEVIENKTNMKLSITKEEKIAKLEKSLTSILGQEKPIETIIDTMRLDNDKGLSFLLVGSSGVGKTKTVKIISDTLKTNLLRIDMSEYNSEESINRLLGSPSGYVGYGKEYVFQKLLEQPYSTILFDEIEKAHPKVLNLLLQILDEGYITDRLGNKIRFDHTYIFLTSNITLNEKIGFENVLNDSLDQILSKELVGRLDCVVYYNKITKEVATKFIKDNIKNDCNIEELLKKSNYEKYGLRELQQLINKQNKKIILQSKC